MYVVGGGPGGLQAAVTAACRGLVNPVRARADSTGGQVTVAASVPSRAEFGKLVRNLADEAGRLGVDIRTGHEVDAEFLRAERPDAVVLATGAVPVQPAWAHGHPRVVDVRQVLDGTYAPAGTVVVIDELGFHQATSAAELLADRGCAVQVMTSAMVVGQDLGLTLDFETWNVEAGALGIRQQTDLVVLGARDEAAGPPGAQRRGRRPCILRAGTAASPDRNSARGGLRLGGLRGPAPARRRAVARAARGQPGRC